MFLIRCTAVARVQCSRAKRSPPPLGRPMMDQRAQQTKDAFTNRPAERALRGAATGDSVCTPPVLNAACLEEFDRPRARPCCTPSCLQACTSLSRAWCMRAPAVRRRSRLHAGSHAPRSLPGTSSILDITRALRALSAPANQHVFLCIAASTTATAMHVLGCKPNTSAQAWCRYVGHGSCGAPDARGRAGHPPPS